MWPARGGQPGSDAGPDDPGPPLVASLANRVAVSDTTVYETLALPLQGRWCEAVDLIDDEQVAVVDVERRWGVALGGEVLGVG